MESGRQQHRQLSATIAATMMITTKLLLFLQVLGTASSFSAPATTSSSSNRPPWQKFLDSFFSSSSDTSSNNNNAAKRSELKQQILSECRSNIGANTPEIRTRIESIMYELAPYNPTPQTATSPKLQRKWRLEWTSEKEINFFLEKGISNEILQTLSGGDTLENYIPFVKGGGFGVTGNINVDETSEGLIRTTFKFSNAKLDLGRWGTYNFPPVGEGWFDTIYLDDGKFVYCCTYSKYCI